ncbi:MAG: ribosome recycling factor [Proteobacteria bacterium]|nr:ribosome recycling factor [Pseudomonadota bacterium]
MIDSAINQAETRMKKSVQTLQDNLGKLRTGRAHPSILDSIRVEYYQQQVPLSQVANVAVENSRTLTVTPWEKDMVAKVEKAIRSSDLGLNPTTVGMLIRIPLPALNEERRRDLVRVVKDEAEQARVAVRNIRRDINQDFKNWLKDKKISEDEERRAATKIQKLTDQYIVKIDQLAAEKEQDLLAI